MKWLAATLFSLCLVGVVWAGIAWWRMPGSEVVVVNDASAPIKSGMLRVGGRDEGLGGMAVGSSRRFPYKWPMHREADFRIEARLATGKPITGRFGYVVSIPTDMRQSNTVYIRDDGICATVSFYGRAPEPSDSDKLGRPIVC